MLIEFDSISVRNGDRILAQVTEAVGKGDCVLDFSRVKSVDSTALAVLLTAQRVARKTDKTLQLQHLPAQVGSLVKAYGVQSLFPEISVP